MAKAQTEKLKEFRDQLETLTSSSARQLSEARQEASVGAKALRDEVATNLKAFRETITRTMMDNAMVQKAKQDSFSTQLQKGKLHNAPWT
jgi:ElaB/YqjD/DUF883 family membrane-anchored ribosome-binding protein